MFACALFLMGPVLGDDRSCHADQLNLLQLRNGRGADAGRGTTPADALGLEPDSDDVDALEKISGRGSTSFVELEEESTSGDFRLAVTRAYVDEGKPPNAKKNWRGGPSGIDQIFGGANHRTWSNTHFWPVTPGGEEAVVWQCRASHAVKMTSFGPNSRTITLLRPEDLPHPESPYPKGELAFAVQSHEEIIVWITWPELYLLNGGKQVLGQNAQVACKNTLYKFDGASGSKLQERDAELGVAHLANGFASAKYVKQKRMILATFRYGMMSRHQASTAWFVDPGTLTAKPAGAYQSHSFMNSISVFPDGSASILSLGDARCRGIMHVRANAAMLLETNATLGSATSQRSHVATAKLDPPEGDDGELGSPLPNPDDQDEVSSSGETIEDSVGKSYSSCAFRPMNKMCRNTAKYNQIYMELAHPTMGRRKDGRDFAVFGAEDGTVGEEDCFVAQDPQNVILKTSGERKLTNFRTTAEGSVSRIKQLELGPVGTTGRHLLMYEVWKTKGKKTQWPSPGMVEYDTTVVMVVDDDGQTLAGPWEPTLRGDQILGGGDELQLIGGKAVIYDGGAGEILRYELTVADEGRGLPPAPPPTPYPTPPPPPSSFGLQKESGGDRCVKTAGVGQPLAEGTTGSGCTQFTLSRNMETQTFSFRAGGGCVDWFKNRQVFGLWNCNGKNPNQQFDYDARKGVFYCASDDAALYIVGFEPPTPRPTPPPSPSRSSKVEIMELKHQAGGCKGKVGKKGNRWLIERGATEESCQRACLEEKGCKYATLQKKGKSSKWTCASFKKCRKMKKSDKFMTFAKAKVTSAEADELGEIWTETNDDWGDYDLPPLPPIVQ